MYNEDRKKEYLAYKKQEYLRHLFVDSEEYEKELGKDLCDMDTSELLHYLLRYDGYRTFEDKRRQISNYTEWCVIKGYALMNWIAPRILPGKKLKEIYVSAKDDFYISRERFAEYLKKLTDSCYGVYIASVFWCIYEGISGKGFYNLAKLRVGDLKDSGGRIRLAGGRGLLGDKGEACFLSGANAAISGDMLTTAGITVETDMELLRSSGFEVKRHDG